MFIDEFKGQMKEAALLEESITGTIATLIQFEAKQFDFDAALTPEEQREFHELLKTIGEDTKRHRQVIGELIERIDREDNRDL